MVQIKDKTFLYYKYLYIRYVSLIIENNLKKVSRIFEIIKLKIRLLDYGLKIFQSP